MNAAARQKSVLAGANQKYPDQTNAPSATDSAHIKYI